MTESELWETLRGGETQDKDLDARIRDLEGIYAHAGRAFVRLACSVEGADVDILMGARDHIASLYNRLKALKARR